jgi:hypothetical protein
MPRVTNGYGELEFVIAAKTFHILVDHIYDNRRIFTDGRPWPEHLISVDQPKPSPIMQ